MENTISTIVESPQISEDTPKEVHSVFDSESLLRQDAGHQLEAYDQVAIDAMTEMAATMRYVNDAKMTDFEHQAGKQMSATIFESKVLKLNPTLFFQTRLNNDLNTWQQYPEVRVLFQKNPAGEAKYIASYIHRPMLPEFTVMLMRTVEVPVLEKKFNAYDFPDAEVVAYEDYWDPTPGTGGWKQAPVWEFTSATPLDKTMEEPYGSLPGWRSVLLMLIWNKLTSLASVEREFGAADNAVWANKTGKQQNSGVLV